MGIPVIIENDDDSVVIITPDDEPYPVPVEEPESTVISIEGGTTDLYVNEIINYDGGHPDTLYGDLPHLSGGGVI
jgi:hypothetical protein